MDWWAVLTYCSSARLTTQVISMISG